MKNSPTHASVIAYKFRSPAQFAFAADILLKRRLHCSDWAGLNDPMEGMFVVNTTSGIDPRDQIDAIIREKKRLKVCALSQTFNCHLLWAHYAAGFTGMALEVALAQPDPRVKQVTYEGVFASVPLHGPFDPEATANRILSSKYAEWSYEREVRILTTDTWYELDLPVRRVIVGHRMDPALVDALRIICGHLRIPICRTGIGDEGIDADALTPR